MLGKTLQIRHNGVYEEGDSSHSTDEIAMF